MDDAALNPLVQLIPLTIFSIGFGIIAFRLAREKGRNVALWTVLGAIPFVNFCCMPFFVGAANLRLERKIDELLLRTKGSTHPTAEPLS